VAGLVTFLLLGRPLLAGLAGETALSPRRWPVRAGFAMTKKPGRREFVRARLDTAADGTPVAVRLERQGAGMLSALAEADGLVDLAEDTTAVAEGETVRFLALSDIV
jgi:molybdopterin molybdotransferase